MSQDPCTLTLADGTHYDLSQLASAKSDYLVESEGLTYKLNVCRGVVSEMWKVDMPDTVGGFVTRQDGDFSLGQMNTTLFTSPSTSEPIMVLSEGSLCPLAPLTKASTAIRFTCSPSDFGAGQPKLIAALPAGDPDYYCSFFFEWPTHVACPTNPKAELAKEHYIAFGAFVLIAFLTWFFGHTLYNRFYLKRAGSEIFPFPSLKKWSLPKPRIPGFGKSDSAPKRGFGWNSRRSGGYSNIRADDHDEEEQFASRFSLEDDDEDAADLSPSIVGSRVLGEEANAWRGERSNGTGTGGIGTGSTGKQPKLGAHQGLVDI